MKLQQFVTLIMNKMNQAINKASSFKKIKENTHLSLFNKT